MTIAENIIRYAKKIAQYREYPVLVNGLQPLEDYEHNGKQYDGLITKYHHEFQELREAFVSWQSGHGKTEWHVLHEAADVYYYRCQIDSQTSTDNWGVDWRSIKIYLPMKWNRRTVEEAADAKYGWRSEKPGNKDEAYEIDLIQERVASLPEESAFGRPVVFQSVPFNLKELSVEAVNYIDTTRGEKSRRARLEEIIREHKQSHV